MARYLRERKRGMDGWMDVGKKREGGREGGRKENREKKRLCVCVCVWSTPYKRTASSKWRSSILPRSLFYVRNKSCNYIIHQWILSPPPSPPHSLPPWCLALLYLEGLHWSGYSGYQPLLDQSQEHVKQEHLQKNAHYIKWMWLSHDRNQISCQPFPDISLYTICTCICMYVCLLIAQWLEHWQLKPVTWVRFPVTPCPILPL